MLASWRALLLMLAIFTPLLLPGRWRGPGRCGSGPRRDAATQSMIRAAAHPLFRAAGVNPARVRLAAAPFRALDAFRTPGNRLLIGALARAARSALARGARLRDDGAMAGRPPAQRDPGGGPG